MENHHVIGGEACSKRKKRFIFALIGVTVIAAGAGAAGGWVGGVKTAHHYECNPTTVPLEEVMKDKLKINLREGGLNLTELAKAIEANSLRSTREKLVGIIGDIFSYMKGIFQHIKIIFYVVSICMMVYDGYR